MFKYYIKNIILKLLNVIIIIDINKMIHYKFISAILYTSIVIVKKLITQDIFIVL